MKRYKMNREQRKLKAAWQMVFRAERDGRLKKTVAIQQAVSFLLID